MPCKHGAGGVGTGAPLPSPLPHGPGLLLLGVKEAPESCLPALTSQTAKAVPCPGEEGIRPRGVSEAEAAPSAPVAGGSQTLCPVCTHPVHSGTGAPWGKRARQWDERNPGLPLGGGRGKRRRVLVGRQATGFPGAAAGPAPGVTLLSPATLIFHSVLRALRSPGTAAIMSAAQGSLLRDTGCAFSSGFRGRLRRDEHGL